MVVRIRLRLGQKGSSGAFNRQTALALSSLMTPIALMAWALGCWRLASDMKWTGEFAITQGLFSHWQVWFALGIAVQFAAFLLHRFGGRDEDTDDAAFS
jgi:hypothetical protein